MNTAHLAIFLLALIPMGSAFAMWPYADPVVVDHIEHGKNFDREEISPGKFVWTSKPERLEDYQSHFVDYRYQDKPAYFTFESASVALTFDKSACVIRLFDSGTVGTGETPIVPTISTIDKEAVNGTDIWYRTGLSDQSCQFSYSSNDSGVTITAKQSALNLFGQGSEIVNIYDIDYRGTIKQTYRHYNNDQSKSDHKYGFTQVMSGDFAIQIGDKTYHSSDTAVFTKEQLEGKVITITKDGVTITYDTENEIHGYLWAVKIQRNSLIFDFTYSKGRLDVGDTLEIDPTYGYTSGTQYGPQANLPGAASATCNAANYATNAGGVAVRKRASTTASECSGQVWDWNVSTIPVGSTITNATIRIDISGVTNAQNCDITQITTNPATDTGQQLWDDMVGLTSDVDYISNNSFCTTNGNDKDLILGSTFNSYLQNTGLAAGRIAVGLWYNNQTRIATTQTIDLSATNELQVTYSLPQVRYENKPYQSDGTTVIGSGTVIRKNATNSETQILNSTGSATFTNTVAAAAYNYTNTLAIDKLVVNQTINKIIASNQAQSGNVTSLQRINCDGDADTDFLVKPNFTSYSTLKVNAPSCLSNGDITMRLTDTGRGNGPSTNGTRIIIVESVNTAEYDWEPSAVYVNGSLKTDIWYPSVYKLNVTGIQVGNGYRTFVSNVQIVTDNVTAAPTALSAAPMSETTVNLSWTAPTATHGDAVSGYRIWRDGSVLVSDTGGTGTTYSDGAAGPGGTSHTYMVCALNRIGCSPYSGSATATTYDKTGGTITIIIGNIGDTINVNSTITLTAGSPSPFTVSSISLYSNNTLVYTNGTSFSISGLSTPTVNRMWYRIMDDSLHVFHVRAVVSNATGTVTLGSAATNVTREYDPGYVAAIDDPSVEGFQNNTVSRFDSQDGILLHVNRVGGTLGSTWTINCIAQTNAQAASTKNQSQTWVGTWNNHTGVGYLNATWTGFASTHAYITCFNPPGLLFTTTSYTNSSLSLLGIQLFDESYGSMLGVPVGIFFLAMAAGMANKRTAPTWIIVILGMAGAMAAIGFFSLNPLVWGLALVTGLLGIIVNQKIF